MASVGGGSKPEGASPRRLTSPRCVAWECKSWAKLCFDGGWASLHAKASASLA